MTLALVTVLSSCKEEEDLGTESSTPSQPTQGGETEVTPPGTETETTPPATEVVDTISTIILGNLRIQLLSETIVRVEEKGPKGFEDRPSYIVSNRDNYEHVNYTLEDTDYGQLVKTDNYHIQVPADGLVDNVYITTPEGDVLWNYKNAGRTDTNVYLPSPSDELSSWYFTDSPRIIPSEYGYSSVDEVDPLQGWDFDNNAIDAFVFLPQGNYTQFCNDYVKVTGQSEMVNLQTLGFWDSRWYAYSSETALQQIQDYRDRGYSIDVMVIDTDWRKNASIGYEINDSLFPNMAEFLAECERLGIDIVFNDHPEPVGGTNNSLDKGEVDYRNENLTLVLSLGLDYWWYDRNWSVSLNPIDSDISVFAFGMYAYQWITQDYRESITDLNEFAERALIMGNVDGCLHGKWNYASDISAHRYSIQWTGDIGADSTALAQEIYATVFAGAEVGLPYVSSDIGGHTQAVTDSMYTRWIQYGALSTICRVHCTNANYIGQEGRMPWLFGETAEEVAHNYVDMRYRLLPLFYSLSRRNYDEGLPIMQRLDILYPDYVEASRNDQYLLGDYILVAPINDAAVNEFAPDSYITHMENGKEVPGLKAEYYSNSNWSGTPSYTQIDKNINFDWGYGGPSVGSDNFSIKWTGSVTIGSKPAVLSFFGDDTVKVYIDGKLALDGTGKYDYYLNSEVFEPNSKHNIEVLYAEEGGQAHVYMYYIEQPLEGESFVYNSRTVFIPDGTWIDVWSGERYVGPATYTVTHPLETSPIFVREGALVVLAPNMSNVREKDWSEMVLDVYPSANFAASTRLYEDDTRTVGYKNGEYRTTDINMSFDDSKNVLTVKIDAAKGTFKGDLAFETRTWNVRVHSNPNSGDVIRVKVNGKTISINELAKSFGAKPFAFEGAALDGDIYTFSFTGSVYEEYTIELYYEWLEPSEINTDYVKQEIPFEMNVTDAGDAVEFTDEAVGWISYGENNSESYLEKENQKVFSLISSYDTPWLSYEGLFSKIFKQTNTTSRSASASQKDFSLEINTTKDAKYYVLYLGGNRSTAKVTVRDTAGNVQTEYFGNIDGSYLRRVVIETDGNAEGKLYVTYSMLASEPNGTGTYSSVIIVGAIASSELPNVVEYPETNTEVTVGRLVRIAEGDSVNLSRVGEQFAEDTLDWMHFGEVSGHKSVRKIGGKIIGDVVFEHYQAFGDYKMKISYNDGQEVIAHTGSHNGTCSSGGITATFDITPSVKHIVLYVGAWNSANTVEVYSRKGTLLGKTDTYRAGDTAVPMIVNLTINATENDSLTVYIRSSNASNNGNVSLAAVAVTGTYENLTTTASLAGEVVQLNGESINLSDLGYKDWVHLGQNDEKADTVIISNINPSNRWGFDNFDATISYTDGSRGSASALTNGVAFDYASFNVNVDEETQEIILYSTTWQSAAGVVVLDSEGRILLNIEPFTSEGDDDMKSLEIHIKIQASTTETLKVIYFKGGRGTGNAGLSAIAVK